MITKTTVERLGHRGDGIAPGPVFVPGALPGEEVSGELTGDRLQDVKIITPATDRIRPVCSHYKACGGCSLQHVSDEFLVSWKTQVVRDALDAHGLNAPLEMIDVSPVKARRRATFSGRRTKKGALIGLHGRRSDVIVQVPGCQLLHPDLLATIPGLEALTVAGASRKAELSFAVTRSAVGPDIFVTGGKDLTGELRIVLATIANRFGIARLVWADDLVAERATPIQNFAGIEVVPPAGAFLQATEDGQAALLGAVQRAVGDAKNVIDLFSGCGTFSLPLAKAAQIYAVESDAAMLTALDAAWRKADGLKKVTTEVRDLYRRPVLAGELASYGAVVFDPPRAGAEAQVAEIAQSGVPVVVAVSCNPVTFSRDVRILCDGGFRLDRVDVVDQFRWSPHVELVAVLSKS